MPETECVLGGTGLRFVYLTRTADDVRTLSYAIDVSRAQSQHDLRYDPVLKANDKIFVPECRELNKIVAPRFPIPES